ncbi:MAG: NAD(P)/FAD-dependent oxidoreductase [Nitrososphaerota archaeon]
MRKIAVVGLGVAGSYLVSRLAHDYKVVGFERCSYADCYPPCAWATSSNEMRRLLLPVGLNFEDYVFYKGKEMCVDLGGPRFWIKLKGLCTFDKLSLERDMVDGHDARFGVHVRSAEQFKDDYDLIVDSTGFPRTLLPKIGKEYIVHTLEYKVKYSKMPIDDFYIRPMRAGYLWFFPLGDSYAHVGCGDCFGRQRYFLDAFMREHGGEVVKRTGRPLRITPPSMCQPYYVGKVVGIGESVGTVFSVLGEGIIPSLQCAEIFLKNAQDPEAYTAELLRKFSPYKEVFDVVADKIRGRFSFIKDFPRLLGVFRYMKREEERFGIEVRMTDIVKIFFSKATSSKG